MAIEKTTLSAGQAANRSEFLAWLKANAADYFETITENDTNITCAVGAASFSKGYGEGDKYTLANGVSVSQYYGNETLVVLEAYKTDNGLFLRFGNTNGSMYDYSTFITKSNSGNTSIAWFGAISSGRSAGYALADLAANTSFYNPWGRDLVSTARSALSHSADLTAIVPTPLGSSGNYAPALFNVPFCQYANSFSILDINGTRYLYDGAFALKE